MNVQFKKGVLDLLVLSMLNRADQYGYDISDTISKKNQYFRGHGLPDFTEVKNEGYVTTYLSEASGGPARKYYRITQSGREKYIEVKNEWLNFVNKTMEILEVK